MAICPNTDCPLNKHKAQQYGAKCMKCGTALASSIPVPSSPTSPPVAVTLTDEDWKKAARWAIAIDPAYLSDWKEQSKAQSETVVHKYWSRYGGGMDLDDEDVMDLAQKTRDKQEGISLIDDWATQVVGALPRIGTSGALDETTRQKWGTLSGLIRDHINAMAKQGDICTGQMTGGGGATIVQNYTLLDEPKSMRLSLAHETGHVVDILLRCNHKDTDLQKCLLRTAEYAPNAARDHALEFFADSFATVLLFSAGISGPELASAAHALFKGGTVTDEHPSGAERISNIARVALRHVTKQPKDGEKTVV